MTRRPPVSSQSNEAADWVPGMHTASTRPGLPSIITRSPFLTDSCESPYFELRVSSGISVALLNVTKAQCLRPEQGRLPVPKPQAMGRAVPLSRNTCTLRLPDSATSLACGNAAWEFRCGLARAASPRDTQWTQRLVGTADTLEFFVYSGHISSLPPQYHPLRRPRNLLRPLQYRGVFVVLQAIAPRLRRSHTPQWSRLPRVRLRHPLLQFVHPCRSYPWGCSTRSHRDSAPRVLP